jgi:hypothetical protein
MSDKCEFLMKRKNPMTGLRNEEPCGERGPLCQVSGQLTSLRMVLCPTHQNHCRNVYKWTVKPLMSRERATQIDQPA